MMQSLLAVGEYVVLSSKTAYKNVLKFTGYQESIGIRGGGTILRRDVRYSFDNDTFSEFVDLTNDNLAAIDVVGKSVWFQFRYILLSGGPVDIDSVTLTFESAPVDPYKGYVAPDITNQDKIYAFPVTYRSNFTWQPYRLNRAVRLYKDLNLVVNNLFGHDVWYYRYSPQQRSKDVVLMEYSLGEHDDKVCAKVVVPNNQFPDNKLDMGPFGQDFDMPFEVQMDKDYFQSIFGDGAGPQKRDVLFFPRTSRIYEINSSMLFRDFMNEPLYFKVTLIKWLPKASAKQSSGLDELESYTVSVDKLFGEEIKEQQKKFVDPQQTNISTTKEDPVRSYLNLDQAIVQQNLANYYTIVAEYYYDMSSLLTDDQIGLVVDNSISFVKNATYYARVSEASTQPDEQYYFSYRKMQYIGDDGAGRKIMKITPGKSSLQGNDQIGEILGGTDPDKFKLYNTEYDSSMPSTPILNLSNNYAKHVTKPVKYIESGSFPSNEDRSISAWFKLKANTHTKIDVLKLINAADFAQAPGFTLLGNVFYVLKLARHVPHLLNGDQLVITRKSGGNFCMTGTVINGDSTDIYLTVPIEETTYIESVFPTYSSYTDLICQKSDPLILISSMKNTPMSIGGDLPGVISNSVGFELALLENRHFLVKSNSENHVFSIPNTSSGLVYDNWYAIFVNVSNTFKQLTLNVWERQWNPSTNLPATTDLKLFYSKTIPSPSIDRSSDLSWYLQSSRLSLTNLRIYNRVAETDKQSLMLNQNLVRDSQWSLVIDNSIPQSRLPLIGNTR